MSVRMSSPARSLLVVGLACLGLTSACGGEATTTTPSAGRSSSAGSPTVGKCENTQNVNGSQGVSLEVPADWKIQSYGGGADVLLAAPVSGVEGELAVKTISQPIDDAVAFIKKENIGSKVVSVTPLTISGFDEARVVYFRDSKSTNYTVVGVTDTIRAVAYTIVQARADASAPTAAACMRTLGASEQ